MNAAAMIQPFDQAERDELLRQHADALRRYNEAKEQRDRDATRAAFADARRVEQRYYERAPRPVMSACPFCDRPLARTFDPFGFDGLWWAKSAEPKEPPACPHFCVLRGAVNLEGRQARAGTEEVRPGPEVPYVIPRLLEIPGMIMVIGRLDMQPGYTAYPLAYFAERRPPVEELTAPWARSIFHYRNTRGEGGWDIPNDPWNFELLRWLDRGRVRWTEPGSDNRRLAAAPPTNCPFLSLPGRREELSIRGDRVRTVGVPDGQPFFPMD